SLLVQEQRLKSQSERDEEQALKITNAGRGDSSRGRGRGGSRGRGRGRVNKSTVECYKCHEIGHYRSECPSWEQKDANYAYAAYDDSEEVLLMAQRSHEISAKNEVMIQKCKFRELVI
ncbi:retrovirus-related Pol polyprotein from transposon TNT 1-94, partial [Trifolium medium]|nr:retrovirus-related Pol polyprotein from transposon TNT 1-94 [Trifolium medium]